MPRSAPRFCPAPGCPVLTNGQRCPTHRQARNVANDAHRGTPSERGYDRVWQRLRKLKLETDPFCEIRTHCARLSIIQQVATEVDHIESIRDRPDLRLVWSNLRSACKRCHSARTMRDQVHGKHIGNKKGHRDEDTGGGTQNFRPLNGLPRAVLNVRNREIELGGDLDES